ncbi:hypothetical protein [Pacificimonas flava]|uniref:hypothetical protein n=1 Tax=Pacificimonas flava TaxID=1234595 RepID=UPI0015523203|nr:hypothetical protein [Pacificimonas flava]
MRLALARNDSKLPDGLRRSETLGSLLASLDRPVEQSVVRGGYNRLSEFLQSTARRR